MEIIEIHNIREIPQEVNYRAYCAEPSPAAALQADQEKYGSVPKVIYHRTWPSGRSTVYIPVTPDRVIIGSHALIIDSDE